MRPSKLHLALTGLSLVLFWSGGFFLVTSGLFSRLQSIRSTPLVVLASPPFELSPELTRQIEALGPYSLQIQIASHDEDFQRKAPFADLIWGPQHIILNTGLHLASLDKPDDLIQDLFTLISPDFFSPQQTTPVFLPLLWNLPLVRIVDKKLKAPEGPGFVLWKNFPIEDFLSLLPHQRSPDPQLAHWILMPLSQLTTQETPTDLWLPFENFSPLLLGFSFNENGKLSASARAKVIRLFLQAETQLAMVNQLEMSSVFVSLEERLPLWKRASALRKIQFHGKNQ